MGEEGGVGAMLFEDMVGCFVMCSSRDLGEVLTLAYMEMVTY